MPDQLSKKQIENIVNLYKRKEYLQVLEQIEFLNKEYPKVPFLFNLSGACYKSLGNFKSAAQMFQLAVEINPAYHEAHKNLGIVLRDLGNFEASIKSLRLSIQLQPDYFDAHINLANSLKAIGQNNKAIRSYKKAIEINSNIAEIHNNLGNLYKEAGQIDDAIKCYSKALDLKPNFSHAHNNLGAAFLDIEMYNDAINSFRNAIKKNPKLAAAHNNLGNSLKALNNINDAISSYQNAIDINPNFAEAYLNLGTAFKQKNIKDKAMNNFERAYSLKPHLDFILGDFLASRMQFCLWDGMDSLIHELKLKINKNHRVVNPFNLLGFIDDPLLQKKATQIYTNYRYPKVNKIQIIKPRVKRSKIKLGYFSADFHNHATMHLMSDLFEFHDKSLFEIFAFSFGPNIKDDWRKKVEQSFDHFLDVSENSDNEISRMARELKIDIAVDLKGYTRGSRPKIFLQGCAPIQVSYLGYPGTMASSNIDYLIADKTLIPEDKQQYYSEKIVYMPHSYQANATKRIISNVAVSRDDFGLPKSGFIFCCFNNSYKITPSVFISWMRILSKVDGSVLWLLENDKEVSKSLKKEAEKLNINSNRLIFSEMLPIEKHLNRMRLADLFLDTLPYNAHTTASDSLRMGVPVLTCIGNSFAGRVAASLLNAVNLPQLITQNYEEYESLAIKLGSNSTEFKEINQRLALNLAEAPLFEANLFTKNIESAYSMIYERYHTGHKPENIYLK